MTGPAISIHDLPPEAQKALRERGVKPGRRARSVSMTVHEVRTYAIRALATMADLTQAERGRVLRFATKLNDVV